MSVIFVSLIENVKSQRNDREDYWENIFKSMCSTTGEDNLKENKEKIAKKFGSCDSGKYYSYYSRNGGGFKCQACSEGMYVRNETTCCYCSNGEISTTQNSKSCSKCDAGSGANDENTECKQCPDGYEVNEFKDTCLKCGRGYYSNEDTEGVCNFCRNNKISSIASST